MRRFTSSRISCFVPRQRMCWVSQPPPQKVISLPNSRLSFGGVHAFRGDLHRIERVHSRLDELRNEPVHRAAGMEEDVCAAFLPDMGKEALLIGPYHFGVAFRREHRSRLHAEIVVQEDDIDSSRHTLEIACAPCYVSVR